MIQAFIEFTFHLSSILFLIYSSSLVSLYILNEVNLEVERAFIVNNTCEVRLSKSNYYLGTLTQPHLSGAVERSLVQELIVRSRPESVLESSLGFYRSSMINTKTLGSRIGELSMFLEPALFPSPSR